MSNRQRPYSDFLTGIAPLIGVSVDEFPTTTAAALNASFNSAMQEMWNLSPWIDIAPYGEARLVGNLLTYPNDLAKTSYWTATALTITANVISNPADGRITASRLMETAANSAHSVVQTVTNFLPSIHYTVSAYIRPNGRTWVQILVNDGDETHSSFFQLTSNGTVGTTSNTGNVTISRQPNGFYLCQIGFESSADATSSGTYTIRLSTDGSTTSYAGDTARGVYAWGVQLQQTSEVPQEAAMLQWDQTGESEIDALYNIWKTNPVAVMYPVEQGYQLTPTGAQLINGTFNNYYINGVNQSGTYGAQSANPVWIYYRKAMPSFTGDIFDATATYAVGEQIYFTNSIGQGDFWKCVVATTAGQSPDTTAASWEKLVIYEPFLQYAIYQSFADWLISDGQQDKAMSMYAIAKSKMDSESDKMERQMGQILQMKVATHLTSRASR